MTTNNALNNSLSSLIVDSSGRATNANQPIFYSSYSSATTNATGDGTAVTVPFNASSINVGSSFASNTFTAPIAGKYMFSACVTVSIGAGVGMTSGSLALTKNGTATNFVFGNPLIIKDVNNNLQFVLPSIILNLSASDAITLVTSVSGGSKTVSVGNSDARATYFSGVLLC